MWPDLALRRKMALANKVKEEARAKEFLRRCDQLDQLEEAGIIEDARGAKRRLLEGFLGPVREILF